MAHGSMDDIAMFLAQKPSPTVLRFQAYEVNGYTYYTEEHEKMTSYQNIFIRIECRAIDEADKRVYHGTIVEIWVLNYVQVKVALRLASHVGFSPKKRG